MLGKPVLVRSPKLSSKQHDVLQSVSGWVADRLAAGCIALGKLATRGLQLSSMRDLASRDEYLAFQKVLDAEASGP